MVASLATGQIEVGLGAPSAGLFNAIGRGALIKIVGDKGSAPPGFGYTAFVVRKDFWESGQIRDPADLRGRSVALSGVGVTSEIYLAELLERGGLTLADASPQAMAFRDMQSALANGSIDVANAIEPGVVQLVDMGVGVRWIGTDEIEPNAQVSTVLVSSDFAEKRREVAERFMVAYARGIRDYNDAFRKGQNKEDVIQILMDWTGLKERSLYDRMAPAGLHPDGCANPASLRLAYDWWVNNGQVQTPVDLDRVIDMSFCQNAARVLGPYQQ
jgi:NitT/TauT family transport system substrate-binding protein